MKTRLLKNLIAGALLFLCCNVTAQTVSDFENLSLAPNSYWDGSVQPLGTSFSSGNAILPNFYDTSYGGFWAAGWAYGNLQDSTSNYNIFAARPAIGANASANYAIGQQDAVVRLTGQARGGVVNGFYAGNATYAYLSMLNGDPFAKKFGGVSGNDPDWFKLSVRAWYNGNLVSDSVDFYLADFRFSNNALDYIVSDWQWVDLTPLGNADSLLFTLSSSDVGSFGMNTPAFFCMDNLETADAPLAVTNFTALPALNVYPNPANENVNVDLSAFNGKNVQLEIHDLAGQLLYSAQTNAAVQNIDLSAYDSGVYFLSVLSDNKRNSSKLVKE